MGHSFEQLLLGGRDVALVGRHEFKAPTKTKAYVRSLMKQSHNSLVNMRIAN